MPEQNLSLKAFGILLFDSKCRLELMSMLLVYLDLTVAEEQGLEEGAELCQKLSDRPSEEHLDRTIKVLLELGEFDDARKLGSELQIQPINVFLVETAMSIINTCGASGIPLISN